MGTEINKSRPEAYTPADYANAVKGRLPLPITQQITNIYNSKISPSKPIGEPRIDLSEYFPDGVDSTWMHFHTNAVNNGSVPALNVEGSTGSMVRIKAATSEDELFTYLRSHAFDEGQPLGDQPPGLTYSRIEPLLVPLPSDQEKVDMQFGKVIYFGRIDTFADSNGNRFQTELCMYMSAGSSVLHYCDGHNKNRRLGG
jgi:hypothetical protein